MARAPSGPRPGPLLSGREERGRPPRCSPRGGSTHPARGGRPRKPALGLLERGRAGTRLRGWGQHPPHLLGLLLPQVPHLLAEHLGAGPALPEGGLPVLVVVHGLLCRKEPSDPPGAAEPWEGPAAGGLRVRVVRPHLAPLWGRCPGLRGQKASAWLGGNGGVRSPGAPGLWWAHTDRSVCSPSQRSETTV